MPTFITYSEKGASFTDGSSLSGSWTAEYDSTGKLIGLINPSFTVIGSGGTTLFTNVSISVSSSGFYQIASSAGSGGTYSGLNVDWSGTTPTQLSTGNGTYSSSVSNNGSKVTLTSTGAVSEYSDTSVTSSITGAQFSDGSTLSGSWTGYYDASGNLVGVTNATFTVSGSGGTTTFTSMGTLPYASSPSSTSYEIHSLSQTGSSKYSALYLDWRSENPSALYEGTPSLYTSILNSASSMPTTALRLASDGTTGTGSTPTISGLPSTQQGTDNSPFKPFSAVTITDSDTTTTTSATITLNYNGVASDADGTLSGTGLTKSATGTYSLAFTTPASLTSELQALTFTPTVGQVSSGNTVTTVFGLAVNDSDGSVSASSNVVVTATCFLAGSRILGGCGERAVEDIAVGDIVATLQDGVLVHVPVRWVGSRHLDADTVRAGRLYPVRICAGAFADGVPHRDLLVTAEHCILVDGWLIPARMLVNGGSIVEDRAIGSFTYYHVELERHGILLAEGLPAESYLDTGNRGNFAEAAVCALRPNLAVDFGCRSWREDACAPLGTDRAIAEPIWHRLRQRAVSLGYAPEERGLDLCDDPELCLELADGRRLEARWHKDNRHMFHIPVGAVPMCLRSRSAVPAESVGPFVDDRRRLGVAVRRIVCWNGLRDESIEAAALTGSGWHELEGDLRWTDGTASLALTGAVGADSFVEVEVAGTLCHPVHELPEPIAA